MKQHLRHFGALLALLLIAMMSSCSAADSPNTPTIKKDAQPLTGIGGCTTDAQCQSVPWYYVGYCADTAHASCAADGYCYFPPDINNNSACTCIVGDERECPYGGFETCFQPYSGGSWPLYSGGPSGTCDLSYDNFGNYPPTTNCSGTADCDNMAHRPACADWDVRYCANTGANGNQCIWTLSKEVNCACIERSVRDCTKAGGGAGHQTCVLVTRTSSTNDWSHPTAWNTCT